MTKLMQWLFGGLAIISIWIYLILNVNSLKLNKNFEIYIYGVITCRKLVLQVINSCGLDFLFRIEYVLKSKGTLR